MPGLLSSLLTLALLAPPDPVAVTRFELVEPMARALRPAGLVAQVANRGADTLDLAVELTGPAELRIAKPSTTVRIEAQDEARLTFEVTADQPGTRRLTLTVRAAGQVVAKRDLDVLFLAPVAQRKLPYISAPQPVRSKLLVGAHHCPLWEADKPEMWNQLLVHPERTPALGFYDQANPEISDWETKWASEHGVDFFIYCWYRTKQGGPVETRFSSAIEQALLRSKYQKDMKFTIMWENQSRGTSGVADEKDLFDNLLPYWIDKYFKTESYLKVDGKPVLFIYRPEFLVQDLGGEAQVRAAFDKMRQACRAAGFAGLTLLGEYRGLDANHLQLMKRLGLDYTFAYCWYVGNNPTPQQAIDAQMGYLHKTQELGILPQVATVSQAWSGWSDEGTIWKIPPKQFGELLGQAKEFVGTLPKDQLGSQMLLLDNWNEWGEGHYIAPYREYGFGYLDAVREVIAGDTRPHDDLIPQDIGLGPYDKAYWAWRNKADEQRKLGNRRVFKPGAPADGLVGWWAFDEADGSPVALDYSGNRLGASIEKASRAPGRDGRALVCDGGWAVVPSNDLLNMAKAVSIECWVKTDVAGQGNTWMVNRVLSGGTDTGYRLGILDGKPCFEVPQTSFSHHLSAAEPLPTGRWVHLAGTFDGRTMRIYMDGVEKGTMDRPGPIKPSKLHLVLGNYEVSHAAYFHGLLDEVKLWSRALSADEVKAHAAAAAK
ncbi:MAG: glycoside hydrolase family 99-like domain-containing protein [Armatimonadetes bacterium]|nr:glycoside hydrolase family 99-like domain-containing protein [Armatimonadota bacterium]